MSRNQRLSDTQRTILLGYMEDHAMIAQTTIGLGKRSNEAIARHWDELAEKLNAVGDGMKKSGDEWRKYWINLKSRTKMRAAMDRQQRNATGGGPSTEPDLSESDLRVMSVMGTESFTGDTSLKRAVFVNQTHLPSVAPSVQPVTRPSTTLQSELPVRRSSLPVHSALPVAQSSHAVQNESRVTWPSPAVQSLRPVARPSLATQPSLGRTPMPLQSPRLEEPLQPLPVSPLQHTESPSVRGHSPVHRDVRVRRRARAAQNRVPPAQRRQPLRSRTPPEWFVRMETTRVEAADHNTEQICRAIEASAVRQVEAINASTLQHVEALNRLSTVLTLLAEHARPGMTNTIL